jgi:ATP-dependent protease HslVU (ClpYQ) peptidase subunit
MEYMVCHFVEACRGVFRAYGYLTKEKEQEIGGVFLVGWRGRLFRIDSDFQVGESIDQFESVGCGDNLAMGAFHAMQDDTTIDPEQRVTKALSAASAFNAAVGPPFIVKNTKQLNKKQ